MCKGEIDYRAKLNITIKSISRQCSLGAANEKLIKNLEKQFYINNVLTKAEPGVLIY